jgi:glutamate 5-kinase
MYATIRDDLAGSGMRATRAACCGWRRALVRREASLVPADVVGVGGQFSASEPVDLLGPDGVQATTLVHRDALVMMEPSTG